MHNYIELPPEADLDRISQDSNSAISHVVECPSIPHAAVMRRSRNAMKTLQQVTMRTIENSNDEE